MLTKSTKAPVTKGARPKLKDDERAYADWLQSAEGQKAEAEARRKRGPRPVLTVDTPLTPNEMVEIAKKTGARVLMTKGTTERPNERAVIEGILERAAAKATQAISLRIPVEDLEAAKRLAAQTGIGYQVILKDLIHEGLKRTS